VDFLENKNNVRVVNSQDDLTFTLVVTNMSKKKARSYVEMIYSDASSPFGNYYWELYQKIDSEYRRIPLPTRSNGGGYIYQDLIQELNDRKKADSVFAIYDLPKKYLLPSQSDTLRFNFLLGKQYINPGEYGIQVFFRVGDFYAIHNNVRESVGRNYVYSDMYYFKVTKSLRIDLNNLPK